MSVRSDWIECTTRLELPILLAVSSGMRRGEILGLKWRDIDLTNGLVLVNRSVKQTRIGLRFKEPKTKRGARQVALPSLAVDALNTHKANQSKNRLHLGPYYKNNDLVCCREDREIWPPDSPPTVFAWAIRRPNLPKIRLHDLRHTHATQLLKQGIIPKIVSERLGHSHVSVTLGTYSHVLPGMQEDAARKIDLALRTAIFNPTTGK
ncbi:MAG: site-specific integrase [Pseudomonadota bacterium]